MSHAYALDEHVSLQPKLRPQNSSQAIGAATDAATVDAVSAAEGMAMSGTPVPILTHQPRPNGEPPRCRYCGRICSSRDRCCHRCLPKVMNDQSQPWPYRRYTWRDARDRAAGLPPDGIRS